MQQTSPPKALETRLSKLRQLPEKERAAEVRRLALDIRSVPDPKQRLMLALSVSFVSTEGDTGVAGLTAVARTLALALKDNPKDPQAEFGYTEIARLILHEDVPLDRALASPPLAAALEKARAAEAKIAQLGATQFSLMDLDGRRWTPAQLTRGVVLLNFWATWCPPCRKELPDLEALHRGLKDKGLVVLGVTAEEVTPDEKRNGLTAERKVGDFVRKNGLTYPILLDPGATMSQIFNTGGIPCTLLYRDGKLVAHATDMRTREQLEKMIARAGLTPAR